MNVVSNRESRTNILYYENVDIDGLYVRRDFSKLIKKAKRKKLYNRAHEWCAGHGAIGFQLLEDSICKNLVLTDVFEPAIQGCNFTVAANGLDQKVTVYHSSSLSQLPSTEQWDLFVANPPWRGDLLPEHQGIDSDYIRKLYDFDWKIHQDLWNNINQYTTQDADIFIYEDSLYSSPKTWEYQIKNAGLKVLDVYNNFGITPTGYVMHLIKEQKV